MNIVAVNWTPAEKDRCSRYLNETFSNAVRSRATQIDERYRQWLLNYDAVPKQRVRSRPFQNASNFVPQLIRMHTDILAARVTGLIAATRPMWRPTTFRDDEPADLLLALGQWMQYTSMFRMNLFTHIDHLVHCAFKSGTTVLKDWWDEDSLEKVTGSGENGVLQSQTVSKADLKTKVVPFEDFFPYPVSALYLADAEVKFQRIRLTKMGIERRQAAKLWDDAASAILLRGADGKGGSDTQQQVLQSQGIVLNADTGYPYSVIEAHLTWDVSPGKYCPIIVTFNPATQGAQGILRAVHKPGSDPFSDCYTDFSLFPKDKSFYCTCVPAILEDSQEEQAQIHNSRRDASTIANIPGWLKKKYADVNPAAEWYPGKVFELDNIDDLKPLGFQVNYNSLVEEENFLLQLVERYTGVTPASQGQGSGVNGKGGNYASQGTLAMLAESNRRLDTYVKRVRLPFHKLGKRIYTSYRDFGDRNEFSKWGGNAAKVQQLFDQDSELINGGTFFDLSASDSGANRETDRSGLLLMANTMSAYYHEIMQAAQMVTGAPDGSPVKELMLQILDGARDLANRLLFAFDIDQRTKLLPDLRAVLQGGQPAPVAPGPQLGGTQAAVLPESQGPVSPDDLQRLSGQLTQLTGAPGQGRPQ